MAKKLGEKRGDTSRKRSATVKDLRARRDTMEAVKGGQPRLPSSIPM